MDLVDKLFEEGFIKISSFYDQTKIQGIRESVLKVEKIFQSRGGKVNNNGIHIEHPFLYDQIFFEIIQEEKICSIIETAIGEKITLVNTALDNRQILKEKSDTPQVGSTWHTDSRYVQRGKVRLNYGFGYIAALCIDDFDDKNAATMYVPKSHLFKERPKRKLDPNEIEIKSVRAKAGDIFIFDTGLWHSAGYPTNKRRWGMFSMYSPWYFKPYYNYTNMFSDKEVLNMSTRLLDLLHFTSNPPINQLERLDTLISADEVRNNLLEKILK